MLIFFVPDHEDITAAVPHLSESVRKNGRCHRAVRHLLAFLFLALTFSGRVCLTVLPTNHVRMMTGDMLVCLLGASFVVAPSTVSVI